MGSFGNFDDDRKPTNRFDGVFNVRSISNINGTWDRDFVSNDVLIPFPMVKRFILEGF